MQPVPVVFSYGHHEITFFTRNVETRKTLQSIPTAHLNPGARIVGKRKEAIEIVIPVPIPIGPPALSQLGQDPGSPTAWRVGELIPSLYTPSNEPGKEVFVRVGRPGSRLPLPRPEP